VIVAALAILRRDGLDAVSMRRIATELGVAANTLYSHVPDKSALIDALLDAVLADISVPEGGGGRRRLEAILADTRRVLLDHPDLVPLFLARQTVGENAMRLGEAMLAALDDGGVRGERAVRAMQVLLIHTIGAAAFEIPRRDDPDPAARQRRGQQAAAALAATHPRTSASAEPLSSYPGDEAFRMGLEWLLDGMSITTPEKSPTVVGRVDDRYHPADEDHPA
jgi:TetR/AcrR family transcriptional regulator, tetracycline repressor protein